MAVTKPALKRASLALSIILLVFGMYRHGCIHRQDVYHIYECSRRAREEELPIGSIIVSVVCYEQYHTDQA